MGRPDCFPVTSPRRTEGGTCPLRRAVPRTTSPRSSSAESTRASARSRCSTTCDLTAYRGQVTALVGDNGAGKSTLIKAIAGIHPVDSGEFLFEGSPAHISGPRDAAALGIEVVYQDLALADNLDVVQNMFLGRERHNGVLLDEVSMEQSARDTLARLSVRTLKSVRQQVSSLSGGQRQTVAIAKAVLWESKLVILDEPTAALGVAQTRQVLDLVRRLADTGHAVRLHLPQHGRRLRGRRPGGRPVPGPGGRRRADLRGRPATGHRAHHRRPVGRSRASPPRPPPRQESETPMSSTVQPSATDVPESAGAAERFRGRRRRRLRRRLRPRVRQPGARRRPRRTAGRRRHRRPRDPVHRRCGRTPSRRR